MRIAVLLSGLLMCSLCGAHGADGSDETLGETTAVSNEPAPESVSNFQKAYAEREERARRTAAELRATSKNLEGAESTSELRQRVVEAYEARQQLQRAEVEWLRHRLARIEQQIANREAMKDQIIDRRVQELTHPDLRWEPSGTQPILLGQNAGERDKRMAALVRAQIDINIAERQKAAREVQSRNNLKQLALAMHNYHDSHNQFPPAAVMGPDGKTPHSWRVELLPLLDQAALYQKYHMDEPWDGPHNKELIAAMPDVFRSPFDKPSSTNSDYYALVGPGTVFEKGEHGIRIRDIIDGTSNTILLVEAKRSIPWTKPEDIPFDADKPVPELGGFEKGKFAAALADGSVHIFDRAQVEDSLKWMILRNDQHLVTIPQ